MSPVIPQNSFLFFHHFINQKTLKVGSTVRVNHPTYGLIVKQITKIENNNCYWLKGINNKSVSTAKMGAIRRNRITGILYYKIVAK